MPKRYRNSDVPKSEQKCVDYDGNSSGNISNALTNNTDMHVCNRLVEGVQNWNRVGRWVDWKSVRVRGVLRTTRGWGGSSLTTWGGVVRLCLVWDRHPVNATIPAFDEIFGEVQYDNTTQTQILSGLEPTVTERYKVLWDHVVTYEPQNCTVQDTGDTVGGTYQYAYKTFDKWISLEGYQSSYSEESWPRTGALYFVAKALREDPNGFTYDGLENCTVRLRYADC